MSDVEEDNDSLVGGDEEVREESHNPTSPVYEDSDGKEDEGNEEEEKKRREKEEEEERVKKMQESEKKKKAKAKVTTKTLAELPENTNLTKYNRQTWQVPEGAVVRDYQRQFMCDDGEKILAMGKSYKNWPAIFNGQGRAPGDQIQPAQIVVLNALREEGGKPVYVWYLRLEVKGKTTAEGYKDAYILTFIPQPLYRRMIKVWDMAESMAKSKLLVEYRSQHENDRPFDPKVNGWVKIAGGGPKSACDETGSDSGAPAAASGAPPPPVPKDVPRKGPPAKGQSSISDFQQKVPANDEEDAAKTKEKEKEKEKNGDGATAAEENVASSSMTEKVNGLLGKRAYTADCSEYKLQNKQTKLSPTFAVPSGATSATVLVTYKYD